jgi:hypothetical protein
MSASSLDPKDAEIERLREEVEHQKTFTSLLQAQVRVLKDKLKSSLDSLERANKSITFQYLEAQSEIEDWKENEVRALALITELCDALVKNDQNHIWYNEGDELIRRAREATRD